MNIVQKLMVKPWLPQRPSVDPDTSDRALSLHSARIGLWVFLGVVTALFALFISAYNMRMALADWRPLPEPWLLWPNTGLLILSSVALQWARHAAQRENMAGVRSGLAWGGLLAFAFLVGQYLAWRQLIALGYYADVNPANAFFYVFTALHGLHLFGGLVAWTRTTARLWRGSEVSRIRLSVELCAVYWHFLLAVWLVLFGLMLFT